MIDHPDSGDRIVAIRASVVASAPAAPSDEAAWSDELRDWRRGKIAHPLTHYPDLRDDRPATIGVEAAKSVLVEVESTSGLVGVATTSGGLATAAIVELCLAHLVLGEPFTAHERIWDRMFRGSLSYGRKGIVLHAISAIDLAVWDLHGREAEAPVYALLGGSGGVVIDSYATGPSADAIGKLGFKAAKIPLTWTPPEGEVGLAGNIARMAAARDAVGGDLPLMYDAWMSLDVPYATRLAWAVEPLGVRWIEDPLLPDDYAGYAALRRKMPPDMLLAAGEHEYTASGERLLCEAGVDVIQPDPAWCGGLTELRRIATVADSYGATLIPHNGGPYAYHFLASYPGRTLVEFPLMKGDCDRILPRHAPLLLGEPLPHDGHITPTDRPGFGMDLNPEVTLLSPPWRGATGRSDQH